MRGMIVAAGLGTRLRPFSVWRPKPALPVAGLPLIAYPLAWLAHAGVREVMINLHHLPALLRKAAEACCPPGVTLHFSHEAELLHTGGALRRAANFLRESETALVLGGDMVVDLDPTALLARHRESGRAVTMVLGEHPRAEDFGTVGLDAGGRLLRIGRRQHIGDLEREAQAGVYTWVNVLSARAFDTLPEAHIFNHLDDWWAPWARREPDAVGGDFLPRARCFWAPVGTPAEYLGVNFELPPLACFDFEAAARLAGARLEPGLVLGAGASLPAGAQLERVVVWDGERVPASLQAQNGVFANGAFHSCGGTEPSASKP